MANLADPRHEIRDLIYFDFDRAASIYSQITEGLIHQSQHEVEIGADQRNVRRYDLLGLFKPEFGSVSTEKKAQIETKILHHDLLVKVEDFLFSAGVAHDLNSEKPTDYDHVREALAEVRYVRVEGWAAIEDYARLVKLTERFHDLVRFISMCALSGSKADEARAMLLKSLEVARREANSQADRNKKKQLDARLAKVQEQVDAELEKVISSSDVPAWLTEGIRFFIDSFLPGNLNIRVCPYPELPAFHVLGALKRDCLVDRDLETLTFAYGSKPNVQLTMFGLITSTPTKTGKPFDFKSADEHLGSTSPETAGFQKAFRGVFNAFESFEEFVRFSSYPNITIQPIAVYQNVRLPVPVK